MVADADRCEVVHFVSEFVHVLFGTEEGFPCVFELEPDIPCVLGRPAPFCPRQCEVEGVLTGDADGRECYFEGTGTVMCVIKYEIGFDSVTEHPVTLWHFGEVSCNRDALFGCHGLLVDILVKSGAGECLVSGLRLPDICPESVPCGVSCVEVGLFFPVNPPCFAKQNPNPSG